MVPFCFCFDKLARIYFNFDKRKRMYFDKMICVYLDCFDFVYKNKISTKAFADDHRQGGV